MLQAGISKKKKNEVAIWLPSSVPGFYYWLSSGQNKELIYLSIRHTMKCVYSRRGPIRRIKTLRPEVCLCTHIWTMKKKTQTSREPDFACFCFQVQVLIKEVGLLWQEGGFCCGSEDKATKICLGIRNQWQSPRMSMWMGSKLSSVAMSAVSLEIAPSFILWGMPGNVLRFHILKS